MKALAGAALVLVLAAGSFAHAKEWFLLEASENRCTDRAAIIENAARSGIPPMTSPYEMTEGLGSEKVPFTTSATRDARGEVSTVQIVMEGRVSLFWFVSREACESFRGWAGAKGYLVSPSELK
jgi:hypothetical protein